MESYRTHEALIVLLLVAASAHAQQYQADTVAFTKDHTTHTVTSSAKELSLAVTLPKGDAGKYTLVVDVLPDTVTDVNTRCGPHEPMHFKGPLTVVYMMDANCNSTTQYVRGKQ